MPAAIANMSLDEILNLEFTMSPTLGRSVVTESGFARFQREQSKLAHPRKANLGAKAKKKARHGRV